MALNGRVDLNASYDAVSNKHDPKNSALARHSCIGPAGTIIRSSSVIQVLPRLVQQKKVVGTKLVLDSQVQHAWWQGSLWPQLHSSTRPSADVNINAGVWDYVVNGTTAKSA